MRRWLVNGGVRLSFGHFISLYFSSVHSDWGLKGHIIARSKVTGAKFYSEAHTHTHTRRPIWIHVGVVKIFWPYASVRSWFCFLRMERWELGAIGGHCASRLPLLRRKWFFISIEKRALMERTHYIHRYVFSIRRRACVPIFISSTNRSHCVWPMINIYYTHVAIKL